MKKVFIIHGFEGRPNINWFPWLMGELSKEKIYACSLPMPSPDAPVKEEWVKTISDNVKNQTDEIFLVGHSLGVPAIFRYLETLPVGSRIGGVVLVSGPVFKIKQAGYESVNNFLDTPFDFEHIKSVCKNFTIIHGDNDPNVPFSEGEYLRDIFSCELIPIKKGGHLNGFAGIHKLPQALESLLKMIDTSNS